MKKHMVEQNINELWNNTTRLLDKLVDKDIITQQEKLEIEGYKRIMPNKDGSVTIPGKIG